MRMLNRIGFCIDPVGTPLVTGLQLDFKSVIATLSAQPFSWFLSHCLFVQFIHQQLLFKDLIGDSAIGLTEVQVFSENL